MTRKETAILLTLLLSRGVMCYGQQQIDSVTVLDLISKSSVMTFSGGSGTISTNDTVRCVMVCIDTTYIPNTTHVIASVDGELHGFSENRIPYVYWQFGYVVKPPFNAWVRKDNPYEYLDDKRKPLPKSIIVLISKEL